MERSDATKRARRSDELYQSHMSRRELCDRVAWLEYQLKSSAEKKSQKFSN